MFRQVHRPRAGFRGFTLIELAIVVAVSGMLFAGLWRLIASGSQQLREQTAAEQMQLMISSLRAYAVSGGLSGAGGGREFLSNLPAAGGYASIPLPTTAAPAGTSGCPGVLRTISTSYTNDGGGAAGSNRNDVFDELCSYLPPGFTSATTNAFGQTYNIVFRRPANTGAAGTYPTAYEILVMTSGGETIADAQGGRLSTLMGGAGGFIYNDDDICNGTGTRANFLCGAYNGFALDYTTYGIASVGGGHLGARAFVNATVEESSRWLSRHNETDTALNTMQAGASIFFGPTAGTLEMRGHDVNMRGTAGTAGDINVEGGVISLASGTLNVDGGTLNLNNNTGTGGGILNLDGGTINLDGGGINGSAHGVASLTLDDGSALSVTNNAGTAVDIAGCSAAFNPGTCDAALAVVGTISASQTITASSSMIGDSFVYTSDISMKKDLQPLTGSLSKIVSLNGYHFHWKKDNRADIGVVAQEVEKVFPELIYHKADGTLGVEYGNLVAPLIESVKELKAQNEALAAQLAAQKQEIDALKTRLPPAAP